MHARVEAVLFATIAFLMAAQILAGFASLAHPAGAGTNRQIQSKSQTDCPSPASARSQAAATARASAA